MEFLISLYECSGTMKFRSCGTHLVLSMRLQAEFERSLNREIHLQHIASCPCHFISFHLPLFSSLDSTPMSSLPFIHFFLFFLCSPSSCFLSAVFFDIRYHLLLNFHSSHPSSSFFFQSLTALLTSTFLFFNLLLFLNIF